MMIRIFKQEDLKKDGQFKKKNNAKEMSEDRFKDYIKRNNLTVSYGYIDLIGDISDGSRFRCYYNDLIVGVSGIVKEINGGIKNGNLQYRNK